MPHSGHCLCGDIKIHVASTHTSQGLCHCSDCKHISGSAFASGIVVKNEDLTIVGTPKTFVSPGDSGKPVTRSFCGKCGSPLTTTCVPLAGRTIVQTGNFDDFAKVPFDYEMYGQKKWSGIGEFKTEPKFSVFSTALSDVM